MRSKALSFLLSLSLMFCVGFGSSITASAAIESPILGGYVNSFEMVPVPSQDDSRNLRLGISLDGNTTNYTAAFDGVNFNYDTPFYNSVSSLYVGTPSASFDFDFIPDLYDYYFFVSFHSNVITDSFTFSPYRVLIREYSSPDSYSWVNPSFQKVYINTDSNHNGFSVLFKLPDSLNSSFNLFRLDDSSKGSVGSDVAIQGVILSFEKGSSMDAVNSIISAINNQTSELGGKIDSAADDIQQSIEDQYDGEPGSSFPVDDIITQHNEKMGVLSFSSDALMQVLGLLSPDQTLSSELVFPSMSLTIAGQRNKVQLWPEYRFDLNTLKQHWPDFVGLMQALTTALVWIFVLRYCYRVFEKYFLAGGSS